ncbi:unnamed protein product [Adineta steineri]|uniref:DUF676 domain-containing protein n=1 Tax=Adineta steineri TaxID=433720 RepID=A0A818ICF9_9BILA|nr:unnamed protein product [Adineta steineri]CAF3522233.1 unnamed protein product [Adineta steineri]
MSEHVIVLAHGLQGNIGHMEYLAKRIKEENDNIWILNASSNDGTRFKNWSSTRDGIDMGGERIIRELTTKLIAHVKETNIIPKMISFIGSSLGGLYCRYIMGRMYNSDCDRIIVQQDNIKIELELMNYVALASPLISVRALVPNWVYYSMKVIFFGGTAKQMLLEDHEHEPLISVMNDGKSNYFKALASCKRRITVCSIVDNEIKVPYQSSAILPYISKTLSSKQSLSDRRFISRNISGYHMDSVGAFCEQMEEGGEKYFESEPILYQQMIQGMINNLRTMDWIRIDVDLSHAQTAIINEGRHDIALIINQKINEILNHPIIINLQILEINTILDKFESFKQIVSLNKSNNFKCDYKTKFLIDIKFPLYCNDECQSIVLYYMIIDINPINKIIFKIPMLNNNLMNLSIEYYIHNALLYRTVHYYEPNVYIQSVIDNRFISISYFNSNSLSILVSMSMKDRTLFSMKKGLDLVDTSSIYVSFKYFFSSNFYLRHEFSRLKLSKSDESILFRQDATFKLIFNYENDNVAFQAINLPYYSFLALDYETNTSLILIKYDQKIKFDQLDNRFIFKIIFAM